MKGLDSHERPSQNGRGGIPHRNKKNAAIIGGGIYA